MSKIILIGTKIGAGCFDKAAANEVESRLVECLSKDQVPAFNQELKAVCEAESINLLFLAGCVWEVDTCGLPALVFNIHPANTFEHGGRHMYGLAVHEHVLKQIKDEIYRELIDEQGDFFTQICIHQVHHANRVDGGQVFLSLNVPIPKEIIRKLANSVEVEELAKELQKHVLAYEHLLLPSAVNILAQICLDLDKFKGQ